MIEPTNATLATIVLELIGAFIRFGFNDTLCNFKTISLKEAFIHRYFDPQTRIPLLQAVIHDSVLITNHWNSDNFKYEGVGDIIELIQFLYLSPPLYNLNRKRFREKKDMIQHHYSFFRPLHSKYGFDDLISFKWLSDDRLVQEA